VVAALAMSILAVLTLVVIVQVANELRGFAMPGSSREHRSAPASRRPRMAERADHVIAHQDKAH
jgi:hypothetical protein